MGFEKFGLVSFVSESKVDGFVTYLEEGKVMTTRCKRCHRVTFPPKMDCSECRSDEMEWIEIKELGQLITYTIVMYGPAGFEKETPYSLGVAEFPMGIKIFGQIDKRISVDQITVGMKVKVAPIKLSGDRVSYQLERP